MPLDDLTGLKFGRWTVKGLDPKSGKRKYWFCVCDCGNEASVIAYGLRHGKSVSCGCFNREQSSKKHTQHGMYKHPAFQTWRRIRRRCEYEGDVSYPEYGGRGIKVCDEWHAFEAFWRDMGSTWAPGLSIDRKDPNGHYEPGNCRWATPKEQANNRRAHRLIHTPRGWMNISQAAEAFGINRSTIMRRLRDGWSKKDVLQPAQFSPRWHKSNQE